MEETLTVGVDFKGDLDLRRASWRGRDASQVELPQLVVVLGHGSLSLVHLSTDTAGGRGGEREVRNGTEGRRAYSRWGGVNDSEEEAEREEDRKEDEESMLTLRKVSLTKPVQVSRQVSGAEAQHTTVHSVQQAQHAQHAPPPGLTWMDTVVCWSW